MTAPSLLIAGCGAIGSRLATRLMPHGWVVHGLRRTVSELPAGVVGVSESGLQTRGDLERLAAAGYRAFLIGERFMTDPDPARAIADLIGARV